VSKKLWVLMATAFVDMLGFAMVFPLLPFYAKDLGATPLLIGVLISSFSIAQLATSPLWGRFSDRFGRRPVLLIGLGAAGIAYIVFGLASSVWRSLWLLLLSRTVQGAGGGTTGVVQAYIADSTEPGERAKALGWLSACTSAGVMIGPGIGSLAAHIGNAAPGFIAAALCFLNVAFAWKYLPESRPKLGAPKRGVRAALWHVILHPGTPQSRLILIYAMGMAAFAAMSSCVALYLNVQFGVTAKTIGIVFVYIGGLAVVMRALVLGWAVDRLGEARVMRVGALIFAIGLALYAVPTKIWMLALIIPLVPIGQALLFPSVTALSTHRADPEERGQMMGVQQAFGGAARVVGPLWGTWAFQQFGPASPFLLASAIMLFVTMLTMAIPVRKSERDAPPVVVTSA
jgi:MFS family permease